MERAGTTCAEYLLRHLPMTDYDKIMVFCGPGNNGGDGLVIARLLAQQGLFVETVLCNENGKTSNEFAENLEHLNRLPLTNLSIVEYAPALFQPNPQVLVIDALFGIGLSKPLKGYYADIVEQVNQLPVTKAAIDVPSGLFIDSHTPATYKVLRANLTLTFQFQKLAYVMPENADRVGKVEILDIGLRMPEEQLEQMIPCVEMSLAKQIRRPVALFAHKGTFGHGLLIAGSRKMPGAAVLASNAALRVGAGKLTTHLPAAVASSLPFTIPEAMLSVDANDDFFTGIDLENYSSVNAIAIGPGLGRNPKTEAALGTLLDEIQMPVVLDADALNILADNKTWLAYLPSGSILTPHVREFERLAGKAKDDFDRLEKLRTFAKHYGVVVILKGRYSAVAMPDGNLFFNTTGNPGMATGGSGDVLTGILLGLLTRGYLSEEAALFGVFLHGLAGDLAVEGSESLESLLASDICKNIGKAYRKMG
jgi:NAD(P)H-hydrate epimerase